MRSLIVFIKYNYHFLLTVNSDGFPELIHHEEGDLNLIPANPLRRVTIKQPTDSLSATPPAHQLFSINTCSKNP
jgi:hypothetical protein